MQELIEAQEHHDTWAETLRLKALTDEHERNITQLFEIVKQVAARGDRLDQRCDGRDDRLALLQQDTARDIKLIQDFHSQLAEEVDTQTTHIKALGDLHSGRLSHLQTGCGDLYRKIESLQRKIETLQAILVDPPFNPAIRRSRSLGAFGAFGIFSSVALLIAALVSSSPQQKDILAAIAATDALLGIGATVVAIHGCFEDQPR